MQIEIMTSGYLSAKVMHTAESERLMNMVIR